MFEICTETQITSENNAGYRGIAFDGSDYYLTAAGKKKIIRLNQQLQTTKVFSTGRIYTAICYDSREDCFWAASEGFLGLFKLNHSFRKIAQIRLDSFCGECSGVSYCCEDNSLMVSIGEKILHMDKSYPPRIHEMEHCPGDLMTGVTSLAPYYLYHFLHGTQKICIAAGDGSLVAEYDPPAGHMVVQVLYSGRRDGHDHFQLLTSYQSCRSYLLEANLDQDVLGELCPCDDVNWISTCCCDDTGAAACTDDPCGEEPSLADACECPPLCPPPRPCRPHSCQPHICPPPCPPPHPYPPGQSCNAVLESIALEETAIAHILNAEGEKIQHAIACACSIAEILEVNREVIRTIIYVTNLEQVLYSKLDALSTCCPQPHPPHREEFDDTACCAMEQESAD